MISRVTTKIIIKIFKKLEQKNNVLINPKQDKLGEVQGERREETIQPVRTADPAQPCPQRH